METGCEEKPDEWAPGWGWQPSRKFWNLISLVSCLWSAGGWVVKGFRLSLTSSNCEGSLPGFLKKSSCYSHLSTLLDYFLLELFKTHSGSLKLSLYSFQTLLPPTSMRSQKPQYRNHCSSTTKYCKGLSNSFLSLKKAESLWNADLVFTLHLLEDFAFSAFA